MGKLVNGDFIGTLIGFVMWLFASVGVLMMMDLMECFLHALRLHWYFFCYKNNKGSSLIISSLKVMVISLDHFVFQEMLWT